jgi:hypothetical protein
VRKQYQNEEIDTSRAAVPEQVSVALGELAGELREGLLALAVGTGLQPLARWTRPSPGIRQRCRAARSEEPHPGTTARSAAELSHLFRYVEMSDLSPLQQVSRQRSTPLPFKR